VARKTPTEAPTKGNARQYESYRSNCQQSPPPSATMKCHRTGQTIYAMDNPIKVKIDGEDVFFSKAAFKCALCPNSVHSCSVELSRPSPFVHCTHCVGGRLLWLCVRARVRVRARDVCIVELRPFLGVLQQVADGLEGSHCAWHTCMACRRIDCVAKPNDAANDSESHAGLDSKGC
jgi:hypothetical protein